jgi:hypothetical protein
MTLHRIQASRRVRRTSQTKSISPLFIHVLQPRPPRSAELCFHWLSLSRMKLKKAVPHLRRVNGRQNARSKRHTFSRQAPRFQPCASAGPGTMSHAGRPLQICFNLLLSVVEQGRTTCPRYSTTMLSRKAIVGVFVRCWWGCWRIRCCGLDSSRAVQLHAEQPMWACRT